MGRDGGEVGAEFVGGGYKFCRRSVADIVVRRHTTAMLLNPEDARVSALAQLALVILASSMLTYASLFLNFRSGWNALWMSALPATLGFFLNRDLGSRCLMAMVLTGTSILVVMVSGILVGYD